MAALATMAAVLRALLRQWEGAGNERVNEVMSTDEFSHAVNQAILVSLGAQATLTAFDTPDTRSWETLPARVAIARVRLPAGKHTVHLEARGVRRDVTVDVEKGGWQVVSLMALR